MVRFKTGPQMVVGRNGFYPVLNGKGPPKATLTQVGLSTDREFARMLRHPTLNLASRVVTAMLLSQPWVMEGDDDDWCDFAAAQILPHKTKIVRSAIRGILMRGWRAIELAYETKDVEALGGEAYNVLAGVKPLRNALTSPLVFEDTGEFAGVHTTDTMGNTVEIDAEHIIFVNADPDYTGSLGDPQLRDAQESFRKWELCDKAAQRYDEKVAGGFLAIGYPQGHFEVDSDGEVTEENGAVVGKRFADGIKASGYGLYPRKPDPETGEYKDGDWKFDHIMASGSGLQPNFIARLKYLDALLLRVFGIPERAVTEGSFGTKAEAEAHAGIAFLTNIDRAEYIVDGVNNGFVKVFNRANLDDEDACVLKIGEMAEADKAYFQAMLKQLLTDPVVGKETVLRVDVPTLMDKTGTPALSQEEVDKRLEEEEAKAAAAMAEQQAAAASAAAPLPGEEVPEE